MSSPDYHHLPPPPQKAQIIKVGTYAFMPTHKCLDDSMSPGITEHQLLLWIHRSDPAAPALPEPVTLHDYLWRCLCQHCSHACHTWHASQRGEFSLAIESGRHDGQRWQFQAATWNDLVERAVMTLLPGWWTPRHFALLQGGQIISHLRPLQKRILTLRPGDSLRIYERDLALRGDLANTILEMEGRHGIDLLMESIVGSAYELTARYLGDRMPLEHSVWLVERLKQPVTHDNVRAYLSPDRRQGWQQDPTNGLWRRQ